MPASGALPDATLPGETPRQPAPRQSSAPTRVSQAIRIQGEITGTEDVHVEGEIQGSIHLAAASLTVGPRGHVHAGIRARQVEVHGKVEGNIEAAERVLVGRSGAVVGDVVTQRIAIEDGAVLRGSVEILRPGEKRARPEKEKRTASAGDSSEAFSAMVADAKSQLP
jgi:cytoskeletal protein CcmA (bactofilin family)